MESESILSHEKYLSIRKVSNFKPHYILPLPNGMLYWPNVLGGQKSFSRTEPLQESIPRFVSLMVASGANFILISIFYLVQLFDSGPLSKLPVWHPSGLLICILCVTDLTYES